MRRLTTPTAAVTVLTVCTAVQMTLIVIGNITDYSTNHDFVQHVFAMDTTFRNPHVMWRAITNPAAVTVAYLAIIAWEAIAAGCLIVASALWLFDRDTRSTAKALSNAGWVMWLALFGGGFIAIGGEYFEMWESKTWNGLTPALQNFLLAGVGLILVHLTPDTTPTSREP